MSRKRKAPKKIAIIDPKYKSAIIPKLINSIMYDGKKTIAEKIVYDALNKIKGKSKDEPINVFKKAIENVQPQIETRSRRVGGATYQVPVEVRPQRREALAIRWLIKASRDRNEKTMSQRLASEIVAAYKEEGASFKKKQDTHKMAEANKAFSHFRF